MWTRQMSSELRRGREEIHKKNTVGHRDKLESGHKSDEPKNVRNLRPAFCSRRGSKVEASTIRGFPELVYDDPRLLENIILARGFDEEKVLAQSTG